jgi:arylformamidase
MTQPETAPIWRGLTRAEIAAQYDMRLAVPDGPACSARKRALSARVRARLPGPRDVAYGHGPRQQLDIYPAGCDRAPILIFVHGGAWRSLDKAVYAFIAEPWREAGVTCVLPGYGLLPEVGLDAMMGEIREAIAWTATNAQSFGGDPRRIVVAGMSAGAQLAGMALADAGTAPLVAAAALSSGVYDLEPHSLHDRHKDMGLDRALIDRASPLRNPPLRRDMPLLVAVGGDETSEYRRQAREYADLCRSRGNPIELVEEPGRHHFSMGSAFGEPGTLLFGALRGLIEATAPT